MPAPVFDNNGKTILIVLGLASIFALMTALLLRKRSGTDIDDTQANLPPTKHHPQQSNTHNPATGVSEEANVVPSATPTVATAQTAFNPPDPILNTPPKSNTHKSDTETPIESVNPEPVSTNSATAIAQPSTTDATAIVPTHPGPHSATVEDDFGAFDRSIIEKRWAKLNEADEQTDNNDPTGKQ